MSNIDSKRIIEICKRLYREFGPQGWWPITPNQGIVPEYNKDNWKKRKTNTEIFEIFVGAILTQNTSWKNVEKAIINLNNKKLIDPKKIIKINKRKLSELIKSAGYYNQKAIKLKTVSEFFLKNVKSIKKNAEERNFIETRKLLLNVNGIGPETCDSILLYALNQPIFVIDAYTKRIFSRTGVCDGNIRYEELQNLIMNGLNVNRSMDSIKEDVQIYNEYHALLVELAKRNCRKKPVCENCVINDLCEKIIEKIY